MASKLYTLLIGVDKYPTNQLTGCVADSLAWEDYLKQTHNDIVWTILRDAQASKANIVRSFRDITKQITPADRVFIQYAGHGARETAPAAFKHLTTDGKLEIIMPVDSMNEQGYLTANTLADKELRYLIWQMAQKNPEQLALVFDCCHSSGGTRNLQFVKSRFHAAGNNAQPRAIADYVFMSDAQLLNSIKQNKRVNIPSGNHIFLAASRNSQTAKEFPINGVQRGIFSVSLLEALQNTNGQITYRDLLIRASAKVTNAVADQNPQLELVNPNDANRLFLGGNQKGRLYYLVTKNPAGYTINAGALHGLALNTELALYHANADLETEQPLKTATINKLNTTTSQLDLSLLETETTFKALVTSSNLPRIQVFIGPELANNTTQQAAAKALYDAIAADKQASSHIELIDECSQGQNYWVWAYTESGVDKYMITGPTTKLPLVKQTEGFNNTSVKQMVAQLVHIAQWNRTYKLQNPNTKLAAANIKITLRIQSRNPQTGVFANYNPKQQEGVIILPYHDYTEADGSTRSSIRYGMTITNTSQKELWVSVLSLETNFKVSNEFLPKIKLKPGESAELGQDIGTEYPLEPYVPDELLGLGTFEDNQLYKIFVAELPNNEEFETAQFNLSALERASTQRASRLRDIPQASDWICFDLVFKAVREASATDTSRSLTAAGITITSPVSYTAQLTGLNKATTPAKAATTRGVQPAAVFPEADIFAQNPLNTAPLNIIKTRGTGGCLNMLELNIAKTDLAQVDAKNPITIQLPDKLNEDEYLIPYSFDGDYYLPVGFAQKNPDGSTNIAIERLVPSKLVSGSENDGSLDGTSGKTRGLFSTIRIVFQKIVGQKLGWGYDYPKLVAVERDPQTQAAVYSNLTHLEIAAKLKNFKKILVVLHGFTGETRTQFLPSTGGSGSPLLDLADKHGYQMILAYDYDSLNTPIKETAQALKTKLAAAGIGQGHGKTVHLMAHSMGGVVARWFIENEGGNTIINHLIMVGTPNGGTPWPNVLDMLKLAASFALNKITLPGIPVAIIGWLLDKAKLVGDVDVVTNDLKTKSVFMDELANSPDPALPYTIIAGNTKLINTNNQKQIKGLMDRLNLPGLANKTITSLLFGSDNDLVVSKASMGAVPGTRNPLPQLNEAACDHLSYYQSEAGLTAIDTVMNGL